MRKNDPDSMGRRQMNKIITKISHEIGISHFNGKLSYSRSTQRIMHAHASTFQYGKTERHIFFYYVVARETWRKKIPILSILHRWSVPTAGGPIFFFCEIGRHQYGSINIFQ